MEKQTSRLLYSNSKGKILRKTTVLNFWSSSARGTTAFYKQSADSEYPGFQAKFVELMCIRSESAEATESAVDAVVDVVKELESVAPSKQVYSDLCLLLTTNKLSDHPDYRSWNPSKGRINW